MRRRRGGHADELITTAWLPAPSLCVLCQVQRRPLVARLPALRGTRPTVRQLHRERPTIPPQACHDEAESSRLPTKVHDRPSVCLCHSQPVRLRHRRARLHPSRRTLHVPDARAQQVPPASHYLLSHSQCCCLSRVHHAPQAVMPRCTPPSRSLLKRGRHTTTG